MELMKERRLVIARRIMAELLPTILPNPPVSMIPGTMTHEERTDAEVAAQQRRGLEWSRVLQDPIRDASLFYISSERLLIEVGQLDLLLRRLYSMQHTHILPHMKNIIASIGSGVKASLFGCTVRIGLLTHTDHNQLEFYDIASNAKTTVCKPAPCFDCLDQRDVVFLTPQGHNSSTAYIPILDITGSVGVLEIKGLLPEGFKEYGLFERSIDNMKASMKKGNYRFLSKRILWRRPFDRAKVDEGDAPPNHGVYLYSLVKGRVSGLQYDHLGIPYYGGPRFTLTWEDGCIETMVTKYELMRMYAHTPVSLGAISGSSTGILEGLRKISDLGAGLLYLRRQQDGLVALRRRLESSALKNLDIAKACLDAVLLLMIGVETVGVAGLDRSGAVQRLVKRDGILNIQRERTSSLSEVVIACMSQSPEGVSVQEEDSNGQYLCVEVALGEGFIWTTADKRDYGRVFLYVLKCVSGGSSVEAIALETKTFVTVARVCGEALLTAWYAEQRKTKRRVLLAETEAALPTLTKLSIQQLSERCIDLALQILPGADIYVGVLKGDRDTMEFVGASSDSKMRRRELRRGEGVSFQALDSLEHLEVMEYPSDPLLEGSQVRVTYGKIESAATVVRVRGHGYYDIQYADSSLEVGVPVTRISKLLLRDRIKPFGSFGFPFVSVPLRNKDKGFGVINVDTFVRVPKASYDTHPENGVVVFLKNIGRLFGSAMDLRVKQSAIDLVDKVGLNVNAEYVDVIEALFRGIFDNILSLNCGKAVRYVYERSAGKDTLGISPLLSKGQDRGIDDWLQQYDHLKSSRRAVQIKGSTAKLVFVLKAQGSLQPPKIFLAAFTHPNPVFFEPDCHFIEAIQRATLSALIKLGPRRMRMHLREKCLLEIKSLCAQWQGKTKQTLLLEVYRSLHACFRSCHMHVGRVGKRQETLHMFFDSSDTVLKGQTLSRCAESAALFKTVDSKVSLLLSPDCLVEGLRLPCIIIPLIARIDICIGVLCIDGYAEKITSDEEGDEVRLLQVVAVHLGFVLDQYIAAESNRAVESIVIGSNSFNEGVTQLQSVLYDYMPDVLAADYLELRPRLDALALAETLTSDLVAFIHLNAIVTSTTIEAAHVDIFHLGSKVLDSGTMPLSGAVFRIDFAKNTPISYDAFTIRLTCIVNKIVTEVASTTASIHTLMRSPSTICKYVLSNPQYSMHLLGEVSLECIVLDANEALGFTIQQLKLLDIEENVLDDEAIVRPQFIISDEKKALKRVFCSLHDATSAWTRLSVFVPTYNRLPNLQIESCFQDFLGLKRIDAPVLRQLYDGDCILAFDSAGGGKARHLEVLVTKTTAGELSTTEFTKSFFDNGVGYEQAHEDHLNSAFLNATKSCLNFFVSVIELRQFESLISKDAISSVFIKLTFNGIEVGRTTVVNDSKNPVWFKEQFELSITPEMNLDKCVLDVEVCNYPASDEYLAAGPTGEHVPIVLCSFALMGNRLMHLLSGDKVRRKWYALNPSRELTGDSLDCRAEVLLSGRPHGVSDAIAVTESDKFLRLGVLEAEGFPLHELIGSDAANSTVFLRFFFNGRIVHETAQQELNTHGKYLWDSDTAIFSESRLRLLEQSELRIELWVLHSQRFRTLLMSKVVQGWDILFLFGQRGLRHIWTPIEFMPRQSLFGRARDAVMGFFRDGDSAPLQGKLKMMGGGFEAKTPIEDDGRTFFVDVLAAASIYEKSDPSLSESKSELPALHCVVYWNQWRVGMTAEVAGTSDPQWSMERFMLRTPVVKTGDSLDSCSLHIEMRSSISAASIKSCLGYLDLSGKKLYDFLNGAVVAPCWFELQPAAHSGDKSASYSLSNGHILLRGSCREKESRPEELSYAQLLLASAAHLPRTDVFAMVNPFITLALDGQELSRTRQLYRTQNPTYNHLINIFFLPPLGLVGKGVFTMTVYSSTGKGASELLCAVDLSLDDLLALMKEDGPQEVMMTRINSALVGIDRSLTHGQVLLQFKTVKIPSYRSSLYEPSDIWDLNTPLKNLQELNLTVMAASCLLKANLVGLSDPYCVVSWGSRHIGTTPVIVNTLNPIWNFESTFTFRLPNNSLANLSDAENSDMLKIELEQESSSLLMTLDVYDKNNITKDVYLCSVELTCGDIHSLIAGGTPAVRWLDLELSKRFPRGLVGGRLKVMFAPVESQLQIATSRYLQLDVRCARDLVRVDIFDDSDPFVKVYWNNALIGQTLVINNTLSPDWNQKFRLKLPDDADIPQCSLYVEVWDWNLISQNIFMGSVEVPYNDVIFAASGDNADSHWYQLERSRYLPQNYKYGNIQGKIEIGISYNLQSSDSMEEDLLFRESSQFQILPTPLDLSIFHFPNANDLHTLTSEYLSGLNHDACSESLSLSIERFGPSSLQNAFFLLLRDQKEIYKSSLCDNGGVWNEPPLLFDMKLLRESILTLVVFVVRKDGSESLVGYLKLSGDALLATVDQCGTYLLTKLNLDSSDSFVTASTRLSISLWDMVRFPSSRYSTVRRKLTIVACDDLANVNGLPPNSSCAVFYGTSEHCRTSIMEANNYPDFNVSFDISFTFDRTMDVSIKVLHSEAGDSDEVICIGVCAIPINYLISPRSSPVKLTLLPMKIYPGFKFLVSGYVRLLISDVSDYSLSDLPYSCRRGVNTQLCFEENSGHQDAFKLGSMYNFNATSTLPRDPNVLVSVVGSNTNGSLHILKLRRHDMFLNAYAHTESVDTAVRRCIGRLRSRDSLRRLRSMNLDVFKELITDYSLSPGYCLEHAHWLLSQLLVRCFPSTSLVTATVAQDFSSIVYHKFDTDKGISTHVLNHFSTQGQGSPSHYVSPAESCVTIETVTDFRKQSFVTFGAVSKALYPQILVPFSSRDVAGGYFVIEHMSQYLGGMDEPFTELSEIKGWLLNVGSIFNTMAQHKAEDMINTSLLKYTTGSQSSYAGLLQELVRLAISFVHDCKLVEVWQLAADNTFTSHAHSTSEPMVTPGTPLVIRRIDVTSSLPLSSNALAPGHTRMMSLDYEGLVQTHFMTTKMNKEWALNKETAVMLCKEHQICIRMIDVTESLSVKREYCGVLKFLSLVEDWVDCDLKEKGSSMSSFTIRAHLMWPHRSDKVDKSLNLYRVKGFSLNIHRASGLLSRHRYLNPYCEVYWEGALLYKSVVKENTSDPEWEANFKIPFTGRHSSLVVDVFNMAFIKRDAFLGRLEIPFNECCYPAAHMREVPLCKVDSMSLQSQMLVGGSISFSTSVEMNTQALEEDEVEGLDGQKGIFFNVTLHSATSLAKVDIIGASDPFVTGYMESEAEPLFTTRVMENTLSPKWEETFLIDLRRYDDKAITALPRLVLEVWDHNSFAANIFLGCCSVSSDVYLAGERHDLVLGPSNKLNPKQNKVAQGSINVSFGIDDPMLAKSRLSQHVQGLHAVVWLTVIRGYIDRHPKIDANRITPFVKVKVNGIVIGSTRLSASLLPRWDEERFPIDIGLLLASPSRRLTLELNSRDIRNNKVDFLGEGNIELINLLHPPKEECIVEFSSSLGYDYEGLGCRLVYGVCRTNQGERVEVKHIRYDSEQSNPEIGLYSESQNIFPILDGDSNRGRRRIDRFFENPFQRSQYIPEECFIQLVNASISGGEVSIRAGPADIVIMPTMRTPYLGSMNIICRVPAGKLSEEKRDFFLRLNDGLLDKMEIIHQRKLRRERLDALPAAVAAVIATGDTDANLVSYLKILTAAIGRPCEGYIFEGSSRASFKRLFLPEDGHINPKSRSLSDQLLLHLAALSKHGFLLQLFGGDIHIHSSLWGVHSQVNLRSLASCGRRLDSLVGNGVCSAIMEGLFAEINDGCLVAALVGYGEVFIGFLVVRQADSLPTVEYSVDMAINSLDRPSSTFVAPEDGYISALATVCEPIASALLNSTFLESKARIRGISVDSDHTFADMIKYVFQQIYLACPSVTELSVWRVTNASTLDPLKADPLQLLLPHCIYMGYFEALETGNRGRSDRGMQTPGTTQALFHQNRWVLRCPWMLSPPPEALRLKDVKQLLERVTENVPLLSRLCLDLTLDEAIRCVDGMGLYWFRVHTGQVLVALNRGNVASGAYSRLFELNFKASLRELNIDWAAGQTVSPPVSKKRPDSAVQPIINMTTKPSEAVSLSRPHRRSRITAGTSYVEAVEWSLPMPPQNKEGSAARLLETDIQEYIKLETETLSNKTAETTALMDKLEVHFDRFFLAAGAKGFIAEGAFGVVGLHVSQYLNDVAQLLDELEVKVINLEDDYKAKKAPR